MVGPPIPAAIDVADASITILRHYIITGHIKTDSKDYMKKLFADGHQIPRHEMEQMLINIHREVITLLTNRLSTEMINSPYGKSLYNSWMSVSAREVIYALSTAHPMCLQVFRVFKGIVEWKGDDSHRPHIKKKVSKPTCDIEEDFTHSS